MYISIQIRPDALRQAPGALSQTIPEDLLREASDLGITVRPVHPGVEDPNLRSYFCVEAPDLATATEIISRFQKCSSVQSAYLKPREELP